jgi:hypothetical protein
MRATRKEKLAGHGRNKHDLIMKIAAKRFQAGMAGPEVQESLKGLRRKSSTELQTILNELYE